MRFLLIFSLLFVFFSSSLAQEDENTPPPILTEAKPVPPPLELPSFPPTGIPEIEEAPGVPVVPKFPPPAPEEDLTEVLLKGPPPLNVPTLENEKIFQEEEELFDDVEPPNEVPEGLSIDEEEELFGIIEPLSERPEGLSIDEEDFPPDEDEEEVVTEFVPVLKSNHTELSGSFGLIMSENFPEKYKSDTNRTWNITVDEGKRVELTFHLFNIEPNQYCQWDWIRVLDSNGTLMKSLCGYLQQDLVLYSTSNKIGLQFFADSVVQLSGFLASWKAVDLIDNEEEEEEATENSTMTTTTTTTTTTTNAPGYMLTFPQTFTKSVATNPERVCLQVFNVDANGEIAINIFSPDNLIGGEPSASLTVDYNAQADKNSVRCYGLKLPKDFDARFGILNIVGNFDAAANYSILSYKSVRVLTVDNLILIQTDKPDYRPNQDVKFRVFLMNAELRPSSSSQADEIFVLNPHGSRIQQYRNVTLRNGIAQMEFNLGPEPVLGEWKIVANQYNDHDEEKAVFTVSENVLPKFEVKISPPEAPIMASDSNATFEICGVYTHGGKVKGVLNVTFFAEFKEGDYWSAKTKKVALAKSEKLRNKNKCFEVSLNSTQIQTLTAKTHKIQLIAVLEEAGTGTKANASWTDEVKFTPFKIEFPGNPKEHIIGGGFPYVLRLRVVGHRSEPMPNVTTEVCARLFASISDIRDYTTKISHRFNKFNEEEYLAIGGLFLSLLQGQNCTNYTTNDSGEIGIAYPLTNVPKLAVKMSFKVKAVEVKANKTTRMKQPTGKFEVILTHEDSEISPLTIGDTQDSRLKCDDNDIRVFFSGEVGSSMELSYILSSGGSLIHSGIESVTVTEGNDDEKEYIGDSILNSAFRNESEPNKKLIIQGHSIKVERPFKDREGVVTNKVKLLVFVRNAEGRTLSAAREFYAESCASRIEISWSTQKARPNEDVLLNFSSLPNSTCGVNVIDKSSDLLENPNAVTRPRLQSLREALAKDRIVNDKNSNEKCFDANLLFKAVERLGLFVLSDNLVISTECDTIIDATKFLIYKKGKNTYEGPEPVPVPIALEAAEFFEDDVPQLAFQYEDVGNEAMPIMAIESAAPLGGAPPPPPPGNGIRNRFDSSKDTREKSGNVNLNRPPKLDLRHYFPDTWLFDLVDLTDEGKFIKLLRTPHSITSWVPSVVCSHPESGLLVSEPDPNQNLIVNQDFFADLRLPYSVKRGEILPVNVTVFNSLTSQALPVRLSIREDDSIDQYSVTEGNNSFSVCVAPEDNVFRTFKLKFNDLQEVNVTAEATLDGEVKCEGNSSRIEEAYSDVLVKPIFVKPEGFPHEEVESRFLCGEQEVELPGLKLPNDLVPGSQRAWFSITGDILAPAFANLEKLVPLPTGCGEQNMISLVPNIYLMEYLKSTGKDEPELEKKALDHMRIGVQRQNEKFRHKDGGYSIWGTESSPSSMWLTAYVVKAFSQAAKFVEIDPMKLQRSVDWILGNQDKKSGCFRNKGYTYNDNINSGDDSLTAHVLITLIEAKTGTLEMKIDDSVIFETVRCISKNLTRNVDIEANDDYKRKDIYGRALATYASVLMKAKMDKLAKAVGEKYEVMDPETLVNEQLRTANISKPEMLFWNIPVERHDYSESKTVEITAYNVLSLVLLSGDNDRAHFAEALKAVKWLTTKRNSKGGFVSTQDTVVALQAIATYSRKVGVSSAADLQVSLEEGKEFPPINVVIDEDNKLLLQEKLLDDVEIPVSINSSGSGCYMIQRIYRYNTQATPESKDFRLSASQTDEKSLKICARYIGRKEKTNMVLIEVELLSGYKVREESLEVLLNEIGGVEKYENDPEKGTFVIYFESMGKKEEEQCWNFDLIKEREVENLQSAIVKIYDYYDKENVQFVKYIYP